MPCFAGAVRRTRDVTRSSWSIMARPTAARSSIREFPNVQWIRLPKNFGLTKALEPGLARRRRRVRLLPARRHRGRARRHRAAGRHPRRQLRGRRRLPAAGRCGGPSRAAARQLAAGRGVAAGTAVGRRARSGGISPRRGADGRGCSTSKRSARSTSATASSARMPTWPCRSAAPRARSCWSPRRACGTTGGDAYTAAGARRFPARRGPCSWANTWASGPGLQARLAAVFGPLLGFRFGELKYTARRPEDRRHAELRRAARLVITRMFTFGI